MSYNLESTGWEKGSQVETNRSVTAFGRDYIGGLIADAVGDDTILYYDKKRISTVVGDAEIIRELGSRQQAYFDNNIENVWANVNYKKNNGKTSTGESKDTRMAEKIAKARAEKAIREAK